MGFISGGLLVGLLMGRVITRRKQNRNVALIERVSRPAASDFLSEVRSNYEIARRPWRGEMLSFQTNRWVNRRNSFSLMPADIQESLVQAYIDIHLANNLVWLSRNLGRRSREVDESYRTSCRRITERLGKTIQKQPFLN